MKKSKLLLIALFSILTLSVVMGQVSWQIFTKDDGLASGAVKQLLQDSKGNIWALTTVWGIMKYDGQEWINFKKSDGLVANEIQTIFEDSKGNIWLGGYSENRPKVNGLMKYNGESFELISRNPTQYIEEDSYGNIWSWSIDGTIVKYNGIEITTPSKKTNELPSNKIKSYYEDSRHNIWIGTSKGFAIYNGKEWQQILSKDVSKAQPFAYSIIEDNNNLIWCGTNDGIYSYDGDKWQEYYRSGTPGRYFHFENLYLDTNHRLWAILRVKQTRMPTGKNLGSGIWYFENNKWNDFLNVDEAPKSKVTKIFEASSGDIWCDTYLGGIHKFNGSLWKKFSKENGFKSNHFTSLLEDSKGNLWFGLGDEGLKGYGIAKYDGNNWIYYDSTNQLPSDRVFSIIEDSNGSIWSGTFKGIVKYSP